MFAYAVGIIGGIASAVLFIAMTGGGPIGLPLFMLSPLPLLLAALGWGPQAAATAALSGVLAICTVSFAPEGFDPAIPLSFAVLIGIPSAVYGILLQLPRPPATPVAGEPGHPAPGQPGWIPLGSVLCVVAAGTLLSVVIAATLIGYTPAEAATLVKEALRSVIAASSATPPVSDADLSVIAAVYVRLLPVIVTAVWVLVVTGNLWLAATITKISGRLIRPWEDLAAGTKFPPWFAAVTMLAIVTAATGGRFAVIASAASGSLAMMALLGGLAFVHLLVRGRSWRRFALGLLYTLVVLAAIPLFIVCAAGLADSAFGLRARLKLARLPSGPKA